MTSLVNLTHGSNFVGSSRLPGQHFLQRWIKQSGEEAPPCAVTDCIQTATDGAHVDKTNAGNQVFVVPMCHDHNLQVAQAFRFKPGTRGMEVQQ